MQFDCLMMDDKNKGIVGNVWWLAQAISGILLVVLLSIHLTVNHWVASQGQLTYTDIIHYYGVPGVAMMEALFLIVVTVHCVLGLRSILLDLNLRLSAVIMLTQLLVVIGFVTIIYGIYLIIKIT